MKRVLFIAEMNGIAKNLNEEMLPHFQVQLCAADKEYTEKLIHILNRISYSYFEPVESCRCKASEDIPGGKGKYACGYNRE